MDTEYIDKIISLFQIIYINADKDIRISKKHSVHTYCQNIINRIVESADNKPCSLEEKIQTIKTELKKQIIKFLAMYKKEEINTGLFCLNAFFKVMVSDTTQEKNDFEYSMRMEELLCLLLIENSIDTTGKNSILDECKPMMIAFRLAYYYCVFIDNIEHYLIQKENCHALLETDLMLIFREGFFTNPDYSLFMDSYLFMGLYEIPEDSEIKTEAIRNRIEREKLSIEDIRYQQGNIIKKYLGFSFEELRWFSNFLFEHQHNPVYFFMKRSDAVAKIEQEYGIGTEAEKIIDYFSLNFQTINNTKKLNKIRLSELKSILKINDSIFICPMGFMYTFNCFEKMVLKKHFFEYFAGHLEELPRKELEKQLDKHVEKMSSFLAYVLLDAFCINHYTVPQCDGEPIAEIKSIIKTTGNKQQKNILKDEKNSLGDIDVLAADKEKKEIFNIEIKYYKPLEKVKEIYAKAKEQERDKNVISPLHRAEILYENREDVLRFLGLDSHEAKNYRVRTIFVTPRPDFWLEKDSRGIEYYKWVEILDAINKKAL